MKIILIILEAFTESLSILFTLLLEREPLSCVNTCVPSVIIYKNKVCFVCLITKTLKTPSSLHASAKPMPSCLYESLLVKTLSRLAGTSAHTRRYSISDFPREGAGKVSAERPNENVHTAAASCPFTGKDVRRTERGLFTFSALLPVFREPPYTLLPFFLPQGIPVSSVPLIWRRR